MAGAASLPLVEERHATTHKWLIALAVMLGTVLEVLDTSIVNVSLPHMQGSFSASVDEIAWVVTSYLVANGIMIPMTGWISSRFGRKRYFMTSVTTFVAASAACGAAQSLAQMVLFRLAQGAAGAAMLPSSQAILMETFPPEEQQMAMATWGVGLMIAPILGPTVGGWITDNWNWRWNFYINVPIGALALLMVYAFVHDPPYLSRRRASRGRIDYLGIACLVVGLGLTQIVLDRGQRADWFASTWVVTATACAALALLTLVVNELVFPQPVIDLRILKDRIFSLAVMLMVVLSATLWGTGLLMPIFLQELMGYTAWRAGLMMVPRASAAMFSMFAVGQLARLRVDTRPMIGLGFLLSAVGLWWMAQWSLDVSMRVVIIDSFVLGAGLGMLFPILAAVGFSGIPRERMGDAASLFNLMRNTGAAMGISYLTNMLVNYEQVHQSRLVEHVSVFDAWRLSQRGALMPGGPQFHFMGQLLTGQKQGLGRMYEMVTAQAAILSFDDLYRILAVLMIAMVPTFFGLRRARLKSAAMTAHVE
ncbi:MAG TPA: DHA2 family efflux MFS transporter permease subunit [Candidatus Binataceae bacterium]|nr:DHA2 family efflux MFS transporter permease subunit [Candidatus Binataceae bacterium]